MAVELAVIRDQSSSVIGQFVGDEADDGLAVWLVFGRDTGRWEQELAPLNHSRLRLMINGVLYADFDNGSKNVRPVESLVAELSEGELYVVYNAAGIEQGHQLKRRAAVDQEHTVPFSDLVTILHESSHQQ